MTLHRRSTKSWLVAGLSASLVVAAVPFSAQATSPGEQVVTATAVEPAPAGAAITFYLVFGRAELAARRTLRAVSSPDSDRYRHFPSREQIRDRFGVTDRDYSIVQRSARKAGLTTQLDGTGLFARINGTVAEMSNWIGSPILREVTVEPFSSQSLQEISIYGSQTVDLPPAVDQVTKGFINEHYRVKTYSAISTSTVPDGATTTKPVQPNRGTYIGGCKAAKKMNTYSFAQLAKAYGTDELSTSKATGQASRLAIIAAGEGFSSTSLRKSAQCFGTAGRTFERVHVTGMVGNLPEGGEGDLDTQVAQAVLPKNSNVTVIESPPTPAAWFLPWAAAFNLDKRPDAVTMSYGICEPNLELEGMTRPIRRLTDSILVRLGLAGTTAAASSGDDGSSDCVESSQATELAVDYPSISPFITGIGGSRIVLNKKNERKNEVVWYDVNRTTDINGTVSPLGRSGGGGGSSGLYSQPWFQARAGVTGSVRTSPDLAMHGSFGPGWPVYFTTPAARQGGLPGEGFYSVAGTSASTPYFSSNIAVLSAMERLAGQPTYGHIAPTMYDLAESNTRNFFDITSGTNDLYGVGCCNAAKGYDLASGLGAPRFDQFPNRIPAPR